MSTTFILAIPAILTGYLGFTKSGWWFIGTIILVLCIFGVGRLPESSDDRPKATGYKSADEIQAEQLVAESLMDYCNAQKDAWQAAVDDANIYNAVNKVVNNARNEARRRGVKFTWQDVDAAEARARQVLSQQYYGKTTKGD